MADERQASGWTYTNGLLHATDSEGFRIEAVELSGQDTGSQHLIDFDGDQHPAAYFQAVGRGTTAFGRIEAALEGLFNIVLGAPPPSIAQSILRAARTFDARDRIIRSVVKIVLQGNDQIEADSLLKRARAAADKRNILAHGSVRATIDTRQSPAIQNILLHASGDTLGLAEIEAFGTECWALSDELAAFTIRIRDARSGVVP